MTNPNFSAGPEATILQSPSCRFCGSPLRATFADLGMSPLCQTHISPPQLSEMEPFYPLHAYVCESCFLVQLEQFVAPDDIFSEYAYFSSFSDSWVDHAKRYCLATQERFGLGRESSVVEIASNDGYLLQHFLTMGIKVLGIEPAANIAAAAEEKGIRTEITFFGMDTAKSLREMHGPADLLLGNNVLAHVPDLNDFVSGLKVMLADRGVITMEFPHLLQLMNQNQFDTIYHEHFSYFSFSTVENVFATHELVLFDVEELPTHGGSLRIYARHEADPTKPVEQRVATLRNKERTAGLNSIAAYQQFQEQVKATKRDILQFLIATKRAGKSIAGYGAPGKGNTLLNYCGIRTDFLDFTVDRNPYKQGKFTPGTRIPILPPEAIRERQPDYLFLLPWNLSDEIIEQCQFIREWGGQFVIPIPSLKVI